MNAGSNFAQLVLNVVECTRPLLVILFLVTKWNPPWLDFQDTQVVTLIFYLNFNKLNDLFIIYNNNLWILWSKMNNSKFWGWPWHWGVNHFSCSHNHELCKVIKTLNQFHFNNLTNSIKRDRCTNVELKYLTGSTSIIF